MDPLSITSGIVGLVSLADMVVRRLATYVCEVKDAEANIAALLAETSNVLGILRTLDLLVKHYSDEEVPSIQTHYMYACHSTLDRLRLCLEEADPSTERGPLKVLKKKMRWPMSKPSTDGFIQELERHKSTLNLALSADSLATLMQTLTQQKEIGADLKLVLHESRRRFDEVEAYIAEQKKTMVLKFFEKVSPKRAQRTGLKLLQPGTGTWFLDSEEFVSWTQTGNAKLWVNGIPGAGKTVLLALIIQTLQNALLPYDALAYFYCDYKDTATQDPINILGSLAKQLAMHDLRSLARLEEFYDRHNNEGTLSAASTVEDLCDLISQISKPFDNVLIIVDGLDECASDRSSLVELLSSLNNAHSNRIKTLFASRDEHDIRSNLRGYATVPIAARASDLRLYVAAELQSRMDNGELVLRNSFLKEYIMNRLVEKADGMFRWVSCQIDHLCELHSDRERRKALDSLPPTLPKTYERILRRVNKCPGGVQKMVRRALQWIAFAETPLSLSALAEAISVEQGDVHLDSEAIVDKAAVLKCCSSLIKISSTSLYIYRYQDEAGSESVLPQTPSLKKDSSEEDYVVEFAHFTVKEFLLSIDHEGPSYYQAYSIRNKKLIQKELASTCLTYLCLDNFADPYPRDMTGYGDIKVHYPFRLYAIMRWFDHERRYVDDDSCSASAKVPEAVTPVKSNSFMGWAQGLFIQEGTRMKLDARPGFSEGLMCLADASTLHLFPQNLTFSP
ncbi:hypothetical protein MMC30_000158 [Trapelia coarctata]|nr:hypothetical protein [Trapelia coarctata]